MLFGAGCGEDLASWTVMSISIDKGRCGRWSSESGRDPGRCQTTQLRFTVEQVQGPALLADNLQPEMTQLVLIDTPKNVSLNFTSSFPVRLTYRLPYYSTQLLYSATGKSPFETKLWLSKVTIDSVCGY